MLARILVTYADDDSEDTARLRSSGVPKQHLSFESLKPSVVKVLLDNEVEIVSELQQYEPDKSIGSLGIGSLHSRLSDRISATGTHSHSVYEFILNLRGDAQSIQAELSDLVDKGRSDVPVVYTAIEQIAEFEQPVSLNETVAACNRIEMPIGLPKASVEWVADVFAREVRNRRIVKIRDSYSTIHRKWAARLITAALVSNATRPATEALLAPSFIIDSASPPRLLRLWSWLRSLDESGQYIRGWIKSNTQAEWTLLVRRCAEDGLLSLGLLASSMHRVFGGTRWDTVAGNAFTENINIIAEAVRHADETDWYLLQELTMHLSHVAPDGR